MECFVLVCHVGEGPVPTALVLIVYSCVPFYVCGLGSLKLSIRPIVNKYILPNLIIGYIIV